jgi:hypothetical protein
MQVVFAAAEAGFVNHATGLNLMYFCDTKTLAGRDVSRQNNHLNGKQI